MSISGTPSAETAIACGIESLGTEIESGAVWDATSPNLNTAQRQVARLARSYIDHVAPKITPISVEERLVARIGTTADEVLLSGQPDVTTDGVRDTKTGTVRRYNAAQLGAYSLLLRSHGNQVNHLIEDYIKRVPLKADQPFPVEITYDQSLSENLAGVIMNRIMADYAAFMESGNPEVILANPMSMLCSDKYCDASGTTFCPHGDRR